MEWDLWRSRGAQVQFKTRVGIMKTIGAIGILSLLLGGCKLKTDSHLEATSAGAPHSSGYAATLVAVSRLVREKPIERKTGTIGSGIMILSLNDFDHCPTMIDRAVEQSITQVSFVPTFVFTHVQKVVKSLCIPSDGKCLKPTPQLLKRVEAGFSKCFKAALDKGLSIGIVPHLDGEGPYETRLWRNQAVFYPFEKFEGYSYFDIMIDPIVKALLGLSGVIRSRIDFALQGEMGATVFHYPYAYLTIAKDVRRNLKAKVPDLRVGISLNGNRIAGNEIGTLPRPSDYQREAIYLPNRQKNLPPGVAQKQNILALFSYVDFLGMSHYGKLLNPARPTVLDFDNYVHEFAVELKAFGINLTQFFNPKTKREFHLSEFGHGGTSPQDPYLGANPGSGQNPWETPQNQEILCGYFEAAGLFLSGTAPAVIWGADKAFIWNLGSWDIQGIYENDFLRDRYRQSNIVEFIKVHNKSPQSNTASCRAGNNADSARHLETKDRSIKDGYFVCDKALDKVDDSGFGWLNRIVQLDMERSNGQRSCKIK